jgi:hypothetical protein
MENNTMAPLTLAKKMPRSKGRGQGLVEFALISPILLTLLFGVVEMGWIAFNFSQLYNGVREGVRYGSVPGFPVTGGTYQYLDCSAIRNRLVAMAGFSGLKATTTDIEIWYDDGRPYDASSSPKSKVGTCNSAYAGDSTYTPQGSTTAETRDPENGDRIVIRVNATLHFITPFINALAPNGLSISFITARSIFPNGILA